MSNLFIDPSNKFLTIIADDEIDAVLVFSDGKYYLGKGFGNYGTTTGEICFNTSMTGYQEILTDPSYHEQIINFTFPHIGNVGVNNHDFESQKIYAKGLIVNNRITPPSNYRSQSDLVSWLRKNKITGISDVDTRDITANCRLNGAKVVAIHYAKKGDAIEIEKIYDQVKELPTLKGRELAAKVSTPSEFYWNESTFNLSEERYGCGVREDYNVVVIDFGIKRNILRCLRDLGCKLTVVSARATVADIMSHKPDGIFLSNGPGDPFATAEIASPVIEELIAKKIPIFGICLGHQILCIVNKLSTEKMYQGHRGANHPVKNLETGKVEITSQNHGFVVTNRNLPENVEITHLSLFDNSIEGFRLTNAPVKSVQYHPESSPGPHDSKYLFEDFIELMKDAHHYKKNGCKQRQLGSTSEHPFTRFLKQS